MAGRERAVSRLARGLRADRAANDPHGWAADFALFRVLFVAGVALPAALQALRGTTGPTMPWLALADVVLLELALLGALTRWSLTGAAAFSLALSALPLG